MEEIGGIECQIEVHFECEGIEEISSIEPSKEIFWYNAAVYSIFNKHMIGKCVSYSSYVSHTTFFSGSLIYCKKASIRFQFNEWADACFRPLTFELIG